MSTRNRADCRKWAPIAAGASAIAFVGFEEAPLFELVRQVLLLDSTTRVVVRVPIAAAVAHRPHQTGDRVAEMQRDREVASLLYGLARGVVCTERRVRLRCAGQVDGGFGEREDRLGKPDEMGRL